MSTPSNPSDSFNPFLPSTFNMPEDPERHKAFLGEKFSQFSDVINDKIIGAFTQSVSSQNGKKFAYDTTSKTRSGYQYLARITSYPASGTITVSPPAKIGPQFTVFQVWGSASKPTTAIGAGNGDYFSFYGSGNPKITFTFSDTAIVVTTSGLGAGYSGFIVVDYIADGN